MRRISHLHHRLSLSIHQKSSIAVGATGPSMDANDFWKEVKVLVITNFGRFSASFGKISNVFLSFFNQMVAFLIFLDFPTSVKSQFIETEISAC
jgi:hypothetical protein